jgi:hypothetical protein
MINISLPSENKTKVKVQSSTKNVSVSSDTKEIRVRTTLNSSF